MWTLANRVHVLWLRRINSHRLQKSCGEKGMAWLLSKWDRALTPAWTGFYCFSGYITSRMVLIFYAQFRFTDNKGMLLITSKKRMFYKCKGKSGWTGYTPYLGGLAKILGSYFKDMQYTFAALIQGEGVLAQSKPQCRLGTMQVWFPTGEPICVCGSCVLPCSPPVFQIRSWATFSMPRR